MKNELEKLAAKWIHRARGFRATEYGRGKQDGLTECVDELRALASASARAAHGGEAVLWQERHNSIQDGWSEWRSITKDEYQSLLGGLAVESGSTQLRAIPAPQQARAEGVPADGDRAVAVVIATGYPQWLVDWLESPEYRHLPTGTLLYTRPAAASPEPPTAAADMDSLTDAQLAAHASKACMDDIAAGEPYYGDGHDHEGFPGGCERFGHTPDMCTAKTDAQEGVADIDRLAQAADGMPIESPEANAYYSALAARQPAKEHPGWRRSWEAVAATLTEVAPGWDTPDGSCDMERACKAIRSLVRQQARAEGVPKGWKLVPRKLTTRMAVALQRAIEKRETHDQQLCYAAERAWANALTASPEPPTAAETSARLPVPVPGVGILFADLPTAAEPLEMRICELRHVILKPNQPYVFTVDPNCEQCRAVAGSGDYSKPAAQEGDAEYLARRFHDLYESLAPEFGYTTREETRQFDPTSANGRLMIEVCRRLAQPAAQEVVPYRCTCDSDPSITCIVHPRQNYQGRVSLHTDKPVMPEGEWLIVETWVHGGKTAELKLQRMFTGTDEAQVLDLAGSSVALTQPVGEVGEAAVSATGVDRAITELQWLVQHATEYDLDEIAIASLEAGIESMQMRRRALEPSRPTPNDQAAAAQGDEHGR